MKALNLFAILLLGLPFSIFSQVNLITNGDFESGQNQHIPNQWEPLGQIPPETLRVQNSNGPQGPHYLLLDQDPNSNNWQSSVPIVLQQLPELPDIHSISNFVLSGQISFQNPQDVPGDPLVFVLIFFQEIDGEFHAREVPFVFEQDELFQRDGQFKNFSAIVDVPQLIDEIPVALDFVIIKQQAGMVCVDGLELLPMHQVGQDLSIQIDPILVTNFEPTDIPIQTIGFQPGGQVIFNGVGAHIIALNEDELVVRAPALDTKGPVLVEVINPDGVGAQNISSVKYISKVELHGFYPINIPAGKLATIVVVGENFSEDLVWSINGEDVDSVEVVSPSLAHLDVLLEATGSFELSIKNKKIIKSPAFPKINVVPAVALTELSQISSSFRGGDIVSISGQGFTPASEVRVGGKNVVWRKYQSDSRMDILLPALSPGNVSLTVINGPDNHNSFSGGYNLLEFIKADIDGDHDHTLNDVLLGLEWTSGNASVKDQINLGADTDGDNLIGLPEVLSALEMAGKYTKLEVSDYPNPRLYSYRSLISVGESARLYVYNIVLNRVAQIHWGDGHVSSVGLDGMYSHVYENPGQYVATLRVESDQLEEWTFTVEQTEPVTVANVSLQLNGVDENGDEVEGNLISLTPGNGLPPEVILSVSSSGNGVIPLSIEIDSPGHRYSIPTEVDVNSEQGEFAEATFSLGALPLVGLGEHHITLKFGPGVKPIHVGALDALPVSVQIRGFVTKEDCEEIEKLWKAKVAQKEAEKAKAEKLEDKLEEQKKKKGALEKEIENKEDQLDSMQSERDSIHDEMEELVNFMDQFFGDVADVRSYSSSSGLQGSRSSRIGLRRSGSSLGFGFAFDDASALTNKMDSYEATTGRSVASDMERLRNMLVDIENLDERLDDLGTDLVKCRSDLKDLCDNQIPKTESDLADSKAACEKLQDEIDDLVEANKECLEALENQRKAEQKLKDAEKEAEKLQNQSDDAANSGGKAEDELGNRAGSPGQKAEDQEELDKADDCQEKAQELIDEGKKKLEEARAANSPGGAGAEKADELIEEALALFAQAKEKLDKADDHIHEARSSILLRKKKQCEEGYEKILSERWMIHWKRHYDVAYSRAGRSPERWARFQKNADQINNTLSDLSKLSATPNLFKSVGTFIVAIGYEEIMEEANLGSSLITLFEDWFNRDDTLEVDLWIRRSGQCVLVRKTEFCKNGCLEVKTEIVKEGKEIDEEYKIGTIGTAENRGKKSQELIRNYFTSSESRISTPSKGQCP